MTFAGQDGARLGGEVFHANQVRIWLLVSQRLLLGMLSPAVYLAV